MQSVLKQMTVDWMEQELKTAVEGRLFPTVGELSAFKEGWRTGMMVMSRRIVELESMSNG